MTRPRGMTLVEISIASGIFLLLGSLTAVTTRSAVTLTRELSRSATGSEKLFRTLDRIEDRLSAVNVSDLVYLPGEAALLPPAQPTDFDPTDTGDIAPRALFMVGATSTHLTFRTSTVAVDGAVATDPPLSDDPHGLFLRDSRTAGEFELILCHEGRQIVLANRVTDFRVERQPNLLIATLAMVVGRRADGSLISDRAERYIVTRLN